MPGRPARAGRWAQYALTAYRAQGVTATHALVVGSDAADRECAYA